LLIAMSFRRSLRQTVEGLRQARANEAFCIGIADTLVSPIARFEFGEITSPSMITKWPPS
jgi:RpiR family carbohydrate utilization transcriptional regulator